MPAAIRSGQHAARRRPRLVGAHHRERLDSERREQRRRRTAHRHLRRVLLAKRAAHGQHERDADRVGDRERSERVQGVAEPRALHQHRGPTARGREAAGVSDALLLTRERAHLRAALERGDDAAKARVGDVGDDVDPGRDQRLGDCTLPRERLRRHVGHFRERIHSGDVTTPLPVRSGAQRHVGAC